MNKNVARFIAGPLVAAGMAAGALGLAAAANADDPVQAAPDLFSAHSGVIFANAHIISEPDRVSNPGTGQVVKHDICKWGDEVGAQQRVKEASAAHRPPAARHAR